MSTDIISAFSEEQTAKLTGLTVHRLRYWDRIGFFVPAFATENRRLPFSRVYSFKDLISLQVLKALTIDMNCSLQHLRAVKEKLVNMGEDAWARTTLYVLNRKVVFRDDQTGRFHEPVSGQGVLQIPLKAVRRNMQEAVSALNKRGEDDVGRIVKKKNLNHSTPVVSGTRIPVRAIRNLHEHGKSTAEIIAEYPTLTDEDIQAALRYRDRTAA